jgi:hypothetical protein
MKLISLNTWGGKVFEPLMQFIRKQTKDTDIFCLQEIYDTPSGIKNYENLIRANLLDELKTVLVDFQIFHFPILFGYDEQPRKVDFELSYGQLIAVGNNTKITFQRDYFISHFGYLDSINQDFSDLTTPLQQITVEYKNKIFQIFSFHGTPFTGDKLDTPLRLAEAKKVKEIIDKSNGAKILVGDFNLLPTTQSIKMHEQNMINLIKEFNIEKTRSNLSPYFGKPDFQKFADYTFVSHEINVINFQVPDIEISDHLPMILEFS